MPDNALKITLPPDVNPGDQRRELSLTILTGKDGRRVMTRQLLDANTPAPGRIRRIPFRVGGMGIGASSEIASGVQQVDFVRNLETRWDDRLLSAGLQESVDLSGDDPPPATSGYFGGFTFGTNTFGTLIPPFGPTIAGGDVVVFDEQGGYLFAERERLSTQVAMTTDPWTVVQSVIMPANIRDSVRWRGNVYLAVGSSAPMQRRTGVGAAGAAYEDTVSTSPSGFVYASAVKTGSDRVWFIDAKTGETFNFAAFSLDRFETLAAPFQVGDPDVSTTGIGPFGPFTMFGSQSGLYSFTDQGKPIPLSRALLAILSPMNGIQWADPGWNWNYTITTIGLRAVSDSGDDNPVGIGESMRGFTGHNGIPTAIFAARGELWAVWQDTNGDLYGYRGQFGPRTGATGQPIWFPWFYEAAQDCSAIFSTVTPNTGTQSLTIVRGQGTDLTHMVIALNGLDDLDPYYAHSIGGGTAWMTTIDRDPQLLKTFRLARIRTRGMYPGDSWTVAAAFDAKPQDPVNATYTAIDTVTTNGFHTLTATNGGADGQDNPTPTADISGRTIKMRLTQVAGSLITNYITNPSFETDEAGWTAILGTIAKTSAQHLVGDYSCRLNPEVGVGANGSARISFALVASTTYVCSIGVYMDTTGTAFTSGTVTIGGLTGATGDLSSNIDLTVTDAWQTVEVGPFTTASDVTGTLTVAFSGGAGVGNFYIDAAMIANYTEQIDYFDGNSGESAQAAGYAWTGTTNLSTSTWTPGTATPPEVDALEVEYDERPEQVEEIAVMVNIDPSDNYLWDTLRQLSGSTTAGPFRIQLPDDQAPAVSGSSGGGQKYATIGPIPKREDVGPGVEGVQMMLYVWPQAVPLS